MTHRSVEYLGLDLENPFVVSSCGLTGTVAGIRQCAENGAAAVVLPSLFEEQIDIEIGIPDAFESQQAFHPEALDYLNDLGKSHGPDNYLKLIAAAKRAVDIPVIASVNCVSDRWWGDFTRQIEQAGADAIELNIGFLPSRAGVGATDLEGRTCEIVRQVKSRVNLPIAVKIGPFFTSLPDVVAGIVDAGASGLVLFNRFYRLDIEVEKRTFVTGKIYSSPEELHLPLRWVAILSPHVSVPIAASTGVHSAVDAIKMFMVGARVVQIASVLYAKNTGYLKTMIAETDAWLEKHGIGSIDELRGSMSGVHDSAKAALGRLQYIKALSGGR